MLTLTDGHNYICFFLNIQEFTSTTCFGPQSDDGPHIGPKHVVVNSSIFKK